MSRLDEYLQKLRAYDGLKNAILCSITVDKRDKTAEFFVVTDKAYTAMEEANAQELSTQYLPDGFSARMKIVKRVPDEEIVRRKIYEFVSERFPAAAAFMHAENIQVEMLNSGANFYIDIASGEQGLFTSGKILDEVSRYLSSGFCGTFYGNVRIVEKDTSAEEELLEELPQEEEIIVNEIRRFEIRDFSKIDGADEIPKTATYVADHSREQTPFAVCGTLVHIEEKQYVKHNEKTGEDEERTRFALAVSDGTGTLRTTYFPKKATIEKVRELKAGDSVVLLGSNEEYKGNFYFKAQKINLGFPPENFEPVARKSKPVPKFYHTVFPEEYVDYTQTGLLGGSEKPEDLKNNVFVVFDLETTGLNNQPAMGRMDKIIEIGAVKLINGEIVEKFSSFIACEERLSSEIVKITGITDEMLVGAPKIEDAIADFFKFANGAYLVGHNVTFDYRFVQYYGEQNGYNFDQKQFDTLTLAQELLRGRIPKYDLKTVANYYGFEFTHHRAFADASVTAKIFIEFIKARGKLPV